MYELVWLVKNAKTLSHNIDFLAFDCGNVISCFLSTSRYEVSHQLFMQECYPHVTSIHSTVHMVVFKGQLCSSPVVSS